MGEEVPLRLLAEIDAEESEVDVHQTVDLPCECGLHLVPMGVGDLGELYLNIAVGLLRDDIPALLDEEVLQGVNDLLRDEHHPRQRTADDAVKCDKDGERDQGPEAAGHGVDALFAVQLLHFGIELLGVALVPLLKLLDPGLQARGTHHALLALRHERRHEEVYKKREEHDGEAVAAGKLIEFDQRPGKDLANKFAHGNLLVVSLSVADIAVLWYGVIDAAPPVIKRMAAADTPEREHAALEGAVLLNGLHGVLGAGRNKAAAGGTVRRDILPVEADGGKQKLFHSAVSFIRPSFSHAERKALSILAYSAPTHLVRATMMMS